MIIKKKFGEQKWNKAKENMIDPYQILRDNISSMLYEKNIDRDNFTSSVITELAIEAFPEARMALNDKISNSALENSKDFVLAKHKAMSINIPLLRSVFDTFSKGILKVGQDAYVENGKIYMRNNEGNEDYTYYMYNLDEVLTIFEQADAMDGSVFAAHSLSRHLEACTSLLKFGDIRDNENKEFMQYCEELNKDLDVKSIRKSVTNSKSHNNTILPIYSGYKPDNKNTLTLEDYEKIYASINKNVLYIRLTCDMYKEEHITRMLVAFGLQLASLMEKVMHTIIRNDRYKEKFIESFEKHIEKMYDTTYNIAVHTLTNGKVSIKSIDINPILPRIDTRVVFKGASVIGEGMLCKTYENSGHTLDDLYLDNFEMIGIVGAKYDEIIIVEDQFDYMNVCGTMFKCYKITKQNIDDILNDLMFNDDFIKLFVKNVTPALSEAVVDYYKVVYAKLYEIVYDYVYYDNHTALLVLGDGGYFCILNEKFDLLGEDYFNAFKLFNPTNVDERHGLMSTATEGQIIRMSILRNMLNIICDNINAKNGANSKEFDIKVYEHPAMINKAHVWNVKQRKACFVKGHFRHYKSGLVTLVKPHARSGVNYVGKTVIYL